MVIAYSKHPPTTYVLHYRNGVVRREGPGGKRNVNI